MKKKIDWIIHLVGYGYCAECGEIHDDGFLPYTCNAHTHGMERYGHLDFQFVLRLDTKLVGYILNSLGLRVQAGEKFKDGDIIENIVTCPIMLKEFEETDRTILRVIVPDSNFRFPEDEECNEIYKNQLLPTDMLSTQTERVDLKHLN